MSEKHYSRKERKQLAKTLGLKKSNETTQQKSERIFRSIGAGKQIEQHFQMKTENNLRNAEIEKQASQLKSLIESFGEERGKQMMENNLKLENDRKKKLEKRRQKQIK